MRVRHISALKKIQKECTQWSTSDVPPRRCPINSKTKPIRAGWQWRSVKAECMDRSFIAYAEANLRRGDFKSILMEETASGISVIARFEYHSSHPGVHVHAHCERGGIEIGPTGMSDLARVPAVGQKHRRIGAFTLSTFWEEARRFYGIVDDFGPLFS